MIDPASLSGALAQVAERSFFAWAEPCDGGALGDRWPGDLEWLYATVAYASDHGRGCVDLVLPSGLAASLAAAFAGQDEGELTPDAIADGMGELCNMTCGRWLTLARPDAIFALERPAVRSGPAPGPGGWTFLVLNDVPAGIRSVT